MFDIAFFSYNHHQNLLIPGLQSIVRQVKNFDKIILVWDDYVRVKEIDFNWIQDQIEHPIQVVKHTDLDPWPKCIGEWGWIKQQLVKLRCAEYSSAKYVWIIDGDVLVTGNPEIFKHNKPVLRYDKEVPMEPGYQAFNKKYFGFEPSYNWVGSSCLFDAEICQELFDTCVNRNGRNLIDCVVDEIEQKTYKFPFSEFELYGNFCYNNHSDKFIFAEKNWNYAPSMAGLDQPLQVMWHSYHPDLGMAERLARLKETKNVNTT